MAKINILDSSVYNKISAGEVVEKPASVVKELVENSLDAGATEVVVTISNGGITFIEVSDNGSGIESDQIEKVFLPHATSKIKEATDLESISSLGFRGEAMASIASVSMVTLETSTEDGIAHKVDCTGGSLSEISPSTRSKGTTITVRNLFFNTPARLKFLRKDKAEERDIISILEKIAFSNPFVRFELYNENGVVFKTRGDGLLDTIQSIYGKQITDNLLEINAEQYGMRMTGYISNTSYSKPTRSYQTFIVNNRVVTNISLVTALNNVYVDYFVKRTYPFCILSLTVNPSELDVNVHPSKTEIKFEYQSKVFTFVQRNVKKCLEDSLHEKTIVFGEMGGVIDSEWTTPFVKNEQNEASVTSNISNNINGIFGDVINLSKQTEPPEKTSEQSKAEAFKAYLSRENDIIKGLDGSTSKNVFTLSDKPVLASNEYITLTETDSVGNDSLDIQSKNLGNIEAFNETNTSSNKKIIDYNAPAFRNDLLDSLNLSEGITNTVVENSIPKKAVINKISVSNNTTLKTQRAISQEKISLDAAPILSYDYRIVGQIFSTYIILEFSDYIMLIDQHAAAEYKLYTKYLKMIDSKAMEIQPLLLPIPIDLDMNNVNQFEEKILALYNIGIEINKIDDLHYEITAIPALLQEVDSKKLVGYLFSDEDLELPLKERLMYKACRSAIKGNTTLDNEAIEIFIKSMFTDGMFPKCPHGRPSYIKISKSEIEKLFLRIV